MEKKNYRGKFQGFICGDAASFDVYQTEDGVTLGWKWGSDNPEPDFTGSEMELRRAAKAKIYTRGSSYAPYA
jgi:hypothetical protein